MYCIIIHMYLQVTFLDALKYTCMFGFSNFFLQSLHAYTLYCDFLVLCAKRINMFYILENPMSV